MDGCDKKRSGRRHVVRLWTRTCVQKQLLSFPSQQGRSVEGNRCEAWHRFRTRCPAFDDCPIIIMAAEAANWKNDENLKNDLNR